MTGCLKANGRSRLTLRLCLCLKGRVTWNSSEKVQIESKLVVVFFRNSVAICAEEKGGSKIHFFFVELSQANE